MRCLRFVDDTGQVPLPHQGAAHGPRYPQPSANQVGVARVAWCTGGAQGYFEAAIAAGADAFITGEISEPQAHIARETGAALHLVHLSSGAAVALPVLRAAVATLASMATFGEANVTDKPAH